MVGWRRAGVVCDDLRRSTNWPDAKADNGWDASAPACLSGGRPGEPHPPAGDLQPRTAASSSTSYSALIPSLDSSMKVHLS